MNKLYKEILANKATASEYAKELQGAEEKILFNASVRLLGAFIVAPGVSPNRILDYLAKKDNGMKMIKTLVRDHHVGIDDIMPMDELFMTMCPSLESACNALQEVLPITNSMDYPAFGAFYCMLLEEWCLNHRERITDVIDQISSLIHDVNSELGSYQGGTLFVGSEVI